MKTEQQTGNPENGDANVDDSLNFDAEVIVAGGGLGGVAAAIAAARTGAKTLLIERNTYPGGVATAGMCCSILNCFYTSEHKPGSTGIPMEITDRFAEAMGYGKLWHKHKGHIIFDLEIGKYVLQEMLEEAGVIQLYGSVVCEVIKDDNAVTGVMIESKSGRQLIRGRNFVDATGDADVAFRAGVPLHISGKNNVALGAHSLCFRLGNVDLDALVDYFRSNPAEYPEMMDVAWTWEEALAQYDECGTFLFPHGGGIQMQAFQQARADGMLPDQIGSYGTTDACQMHGMRRTGMLHVITGFSHFDGLNIGKISNSIIEGRRIAFLMAEVYRKYIPGFTDTFVAGVADNLGVRISRWLDSDFVLTPEMVKPGVRFDDGVGCIVPNEGKVINSGKNAWAAQVMGNDTFDLPYGCMLPRDVEGLVIGSGRSISVSVPGLLREMTYTMSIGQAAGIAAAVAMKEGCLLREVDTQKVRMAMANF